MKMGTMEAAMMAAAASGPTSWAFEEMMDEAAKEQSAAAEALEAKLLQKLADAHDADIETRGTAALARKLQGRKRRGGSLRAAASKEFERVAAQESRRTSRLSRKSQRSAARRAMRNLY
jgi:hypothetical protein